MDRAVGMDRLAPAAQQCGIARTHAERRSIGGHVGPAFVDDADQADRHAHATELEAIGTLAAVDHLAHRIGQAGNRFDAARHCLEPRFVEPQTIEHRARQAAFFARRKILGIGSKNGGAVVAQRLRRHPQGGSLGVAGHGRKHALRLAPGLGQPRYQRIGIERKYVSLGSHARSIAAALCAVSRRIRRSANLANDLGKSP